MKKMFRQIIRPLARLPLPSLLSLIALMAIYCLPVLAQSTPATTDDKEMITQLLKRIELLESNQKQMQQKMDAANSPLPAGQAAPPSPGQPVLASEASVVPVTEPVTEEVAEPDADAMHKLGPVSFRGYSDVNYGRPLFEQLPDGTVSGGGLQGSPNSFNIGDFDLFMHSRLSSHWSVLGELLITSDFTNEFSAEMDRLLLTYRKNDYFSISAGKFNTALGYYPNAFDRARYFQIATGRPVMYADEDDGGILPVHSVGVTTTGMIPNETLGLHWVFEVGNGRPANSVDVPVQNFVDQNNGKAFNIALYTRPAKLSGFEAGISYYRDTLHPVTIVSSVGQTILTGHVVYVSTKFEWLNEASMVRNDENVDGFISRSMTMYSQLSRTFSGYTPFFRYDYQNVPNTDPIFGLLTRRNGPSIGLNRKFSNYVVFKVQYGLLESRAHDSINDFQAQLAFAF